MSGLATLIDGLVDRLGAALGPGVTVSDATPTTIDELPAVVLSITDAQQVLVGVGRMPRGTRSGALPVTIAVDLAAPVLDLGGGETLLLISANRRELTIPHGPLVKADGTDDTAFTTADATANDGADFAIVDGTPLGRQFQVDPTAGIFRFGANLKSTGTLSVTYHVGQWDVTVNRFQGDLGIHVVTANSAQTRTTARLVADALALAQPDVRVAPLAWGAVLVDSVGPQQNPTSAAGQVLTYRFDSELELPILPSGGGVISRIPVTELMRSSDSPTDPPAGQELFEITA